MGEIRSLSIKYINLLKENRYLSILILLTLSLFVFILLLNLGTQYCCDSNYYINAIPEYNRGGLYDKIGSSGYKSYLFPYIFSFFPFDMSLRIDMFGASVLVYSILSITFFIIIEANVLFLLWGKRHFLLFYFALFLNPLLMVYVSYPLQESFSILLFILFIPLIYINYINKNNYLLMLFLGLFFSSMYMARPSHLLLLIPVLVFALYTLYYSRKNKIILLSIFLLSSISLIIPQSAVMLKYFNTIKPYPQTAVLTQQFKYGNVYTKYGTNISGNKRINAAQPYWNPLACSTVASSNTRNKRIFECRTDNQPVVTNLSSLIENNSNSALVFKTILHIFSALNYDYLKPYVTTIHPAIFSWHQLLSMLIVFLGFYQIFKSYLRKEVSVFDIFLDFILVTTLAVCLFFAVETRFGLFATIVLSIKSMQLMLYNHPKDNEAIALTVGAFFFLASTSLLSAYVLLLSGALN